MNRSRGFSFVTFLMVVVAIVALWLCGQWAIGYFGTTKAQKIMIETVYKHKDVADDAQMKEVVLNELKTQMPMDVVPDDLVIFRSQDGANIQIKLHYVHKGGVPLTSYTVPFTFNVEINENLKR